ncbi:hypothetical protein ABPG75_011829 [Micractinium tetrahymenae]
MPRNPWLLCLARRQRPQPAITGPHCHARHAKQQQSRHAPPSAQPALRAPRTAACGESTSVPGLHSVHPLKPLARRALHKRRPFQLASAHPCSTQCGTALQLLRQKLASLSMAAAEAQARRASAVPTPPPCLPPRSLLSSGSSGDSSGSEMPAYAPATPPAYSALPLCSTPPSPALRSGALSALACRLQQQMLAGLPAEDRAEICLARRFLAQF